MRTIINIIAGIAVLVLVFYIGRHTARTPIPESRVDTLIVYDTIHDPYPVETVRYVTRIDTVLCTLQLPADTVERVTYVTLPIEKITYETDDYKAVIEGYKSRLLSMDIYRQTTYIDRVERYKTKSRWGIGVHVGYGYDVKNTQLTPYVGLGLHYNILTW